MPQQEKGNPTSLCNSLRVVRRWSGEKRCFELKMKAGTTVFLAKDQRFTFRRLFDDSNLKKDAEEILWVMSLCWQETMP